jgi:hypothetical protein
MAFIYKNSPGRRAGTQYVVASLDGVQDHLDRVVFEAGVRAEEDLRDHRFDDHAFIEVEEGDIDRYVILNDELGQAAAMSIEYGREGDPDEINPETGAPKGRMEGLFILHKAFRVPPKALKGTGGGKF